MRLMSLMLLMIIRMVGLSNDDRGDISDFHGADADG